ncbi:hypothetical protein ACP4OV_006826 [Aristida adscensionis]
MLLRRPAPDAGEPPAGAGSRPRLFAVPRLLVAGLARCGGGAAAASPDCDSPTSPLDLRGFAAPGGSLLRSPRSPRSWDSRRLGLGGLVDTLAAESSPLGPQLRPPRLARSYSAQPRACAHAPPLLGNADAAAAAGGGKTLPCSRSYGDVKSGPEAAAPGGAKLAAGTRAADLGKLPAPGSLPASIGGPRRYIGSVSATVLAQSEDYTCIIAHGPNPKTTRIFGDCILEPCTNLGDATEAMEEVKEGAESYWLVKCSADADADAGDDLLGSSCLACNKKLDGSDACVYRGVKAFCSANCRDQEILTEEEEDKTTAMSSLSSVGSSSSFSDDIFMAGMVVLTGPFDTQIP